jgi:hypothetical protein
MRWLCFAFLVMETSTLWLWDPTWCEGANNLTVPCLGDFRWVLDDRDHSTKDECALLRDKGISAIAFCGDSYIRHVYIAFLTRLSRNSRDAALLHGEARCESTEQYRSKCKKSIRRSEAVCNGDVEVFLTSLETSSWCVPWAGPEPEVFADSSIVVWGGGSHPVDHDYVAYTGMFDAAVVSEFKLERFCARWSEGKSRRVFWVSAHASLLWAGFPTVRNTNEEVGAYETEMRRRLLEECGVGRYVDTFELTSSAIEDVDNIDAFSYDGRHWSQEMNLLKVELLLREIALAEHMAFVGSEAPSVCRTPPPAQHCLQVIRPGHGHIVSHRYSSLYYLAFALRVGCPGAAPALSVAVWFGSINEVWELDDGAPDFIDVAFQAAPRLADDRFTVALVRRDGSQETYDVNVDYGPDVHTVCNCRADTPCHTIHW